MLILLTSNLNVPKATTTHKTRQNDINFGCELSQMNQNVVSRNLQLVRLPILLTICFFVWRLRLDVNLPVYNLLSNSNLDTRGCVFFVDNLSD